MALRRDRKVAVICGAASGIGLATVECFVEAGPRVLAADLRVEAGEALVQRFISAVGPMRCDVTQTTQIRDATGTAAARFGGLDILFSNAGAGVCRNWGKSCDACSKRPPTARSGSVSSPVRQTPPK